MSGEPYRPPVWQGILNKPRSVLFGSGHLAHWQERLIHATTNTTGQDSYRVGVLHCGDSLAERICGWISIYTAQDFPDNAGRGLFCTTNGVTFDPNDNFPPVGLVQPAYTGGASRLSDRFDLWPTGYVYNASSGGTIAFPPEKIITPQITAADSRKFTTIKWPYIAASGGGSFDIETSPDGTTWTKQGATVSTSNGSTIGAVATRTVTEGTYYVRAKHVSGGEINVLEPYTGYPHSVKGFDGFGMSKGGITPSQWTTTPLAIVTPILTELNPALVTFHWADTYQEYVDHFDDMMAIARAGNDDRSVLWVASHTYEYAADQAAADAETEQVAQFLRDRVDSHRIALLDCRAITGNWDEIGVYEWIGDTVHLDWRMYQYCYSILEQELPIQSVVRKRFDPDTIDNLPKLFATQGKTFASMALSDITEPGIHFIANGTGMPNNDQGVVLSFGIGPEATHPFALFGVQLATNPYSADTGWYRRTRNSGTWGSWVSLGSTPDLSGYALLDHVHDEVSIQDSVGAGQATISSADDTLSFLDQSGAPVSSTVGLTDLARVSALSSYATTAAVAAGFVPRITSVDNRLTRFDGTTGAVQSSGITVDDSNNVTGVGSITASGSGNFGGSGVATPGTLGGAVIYARQTGGSTNTWRGRIVAGGDNVAFLMGEYNSQAWLGGHNAALNAWAPLRINPAGTSDLYLGNNGSPGAAPILTLANSNGTATFSGTVTGGLAATAVTFSVLNATTATATLGLRRITDRSNRLAYPDGTNWRFVSDDAIIS